jgi:hypothetical protein
MQAQRKADTAEETAALDDLLSTSDLDTDYDQANLEPR